MRSMISYGVVALLAGAAAFALAQVRQPTPRVASEVEPTHADQFAHPPSPPERADLLDISPEEQINIQVYQRANRGVVNITTRGGQVDDFFMLASPREGSGSGSVLEKKGRIVTNYYVIEDARQVKVTLFDSSTVEARLVGSDPQNDLRIRA